MACFDVFNGDADGICALQQIRLAEPADSTLVTGVKRDIALLRRVQAQENDQVIALDISLDQNRDPLLELLAKGVRVRYVDHHFAGEIPKHENLSASIDATPNICTSLMVNECLGGLFSAWAAVGAFGDNFDDSARRAVEPLGLDEARLQQLKQLGVYINYNAYGATLEDLHFPPDELFRRLRPYADPYDFLCEEETFARLHEGYTADMAKTENVVPEIATDRIFLCILPAEAWARRVSGVLSNKLVHTAPQRAHALLTLLPSGGFVVSVRSPFARPSGADELCRQFPTGGGRKAAAGINYLPYDLVDDFVQKMKDIYSDD